MFSMSRNILAISEFTSGGRHIGFQDGRHMFYITLYLISYCTLEGEYRLFIRRKMVTMWKLSSYGRNIEIQDGRHIIRHAVFIETAAAYIVTEKVVISPFRSDGFHLVK